MESTLKNKVNQELIHYSYDRIRIGILASFFCAVILFVALYNNSPHSLLMPWSIFFIIAAVGRIGLSQIYLHQIHPENHPTLWYYLYIASTLLGGIAWGWVGAFLFPNTSNLQQTLCILIVAGVTAGSVPIFSAILKAAIPYYVMTILPFILHIFFIDNFTYTLFGLTLILYLIFLISISFKTHDLINDMFYYKFENDTLLKSYMEVNKKLEQLATHDPLTQVANRHLFEMDANNAIKRARRNNTLLGLLYIDIDNFKKINDNYGHGIGDQLLLAVVEKLQNTLRATDIIARFGGDEFVVVLEEIINEEDLQAVAKRICEHFSTPFLFSPHTVHASVSIGGSIYPKDGIDIDTLIKVADTAMYRAKESGRNAYFISSSK